MFEFEGSRAEFLKLLAEFGETPAFVTCARAVNAAFDCFVRQCQTHRDEALVCSVGILGPVGILK